MLSWSRRLAEPKQVQDDERMGNSGDKCAIPEIALYYNGSGQHLLRAFAALREIILALRFDRA
jgi:hypothetical protein